MANPFTDYVGGLSGPFGQIAGGILDLVIKVIIGILALITIIVIIWWKRNSKRYNIPVTIWIPRSDGKVTDELSGKGIVGGYFKSRGGTTSFRLKRKGLSTIDIPPPSSKFLVGLSRKLYLVQKGPDDFEPVLPDSLKYVTTSKGRRLNIVNLKAVNQDATAWVEDNREAAKRRFTFMGFWEKYKDFIQITIFIFIVMLALYINWMGLKEVVVGLKEVAEILTRFKSGSPIT